MYLTFALITLSLSAFFSGVEIAFISSNKIKLELDKNSGKFPANIISYFSKNDSDFITTMLVGNNIALVIYGILMTKFLTPFLSIFLFTSYSILLAQTLISTLIILVTAEFLPKAICKIYPNNILKFFAIPIFFFYILFRPFGWFFFHLSKIFIELVLRHKLLDNRKYFGRLDLDEYLNNIKTNDLGEDSVEVEMMQNTLDLSSKKLRECMIPRTEIIAHDISSSVDELKNKFIETKLSKIIIFKNNIDNVIGYVHSSDLFKNPRNVKSLLLPIPFVPESMLAMQLLNDFIENDKGVALVVDEFGGTSGMLTIEDVTEEIVGEINDEHDKASDEIERISEKEFFIPARLEVELVNKECFVSLPISDEYETIAGLVLSLLEDIPSEGDVIELDDYDLKINSVDDRSILSVTLKINY
jgi:putative hemolysin|tara:strand:- start:6468 stop:7712 length:1245 start_codon:yes stop_codon:yes gene_type:complete